ncbi:MAG: LuxR C-terminal-related transcriptional regulator [Tannerella sp.]|jgi:DNA-binding CsgD family transcriptional regulator|nr:LuxR C-terminal-related transcriptional regulator [Tannerella sp.]
MLKPRQIAIILPDILQGVGLRSLLTDYFPPVEITFFPTFDAFAAAGKDVFDVYFTLPELFIVHAGFFMPVRNKTVCILPDAVCAPNALACHFLQVRVSQESIVTQLRQALQGENRTALSAENGKELSVREKDVLQLIVKGLTNKDIADKLYISLNTVLTHRKNITAKLGIKTIPGLTFYAITNGMISGNDIEI